MTRLYVCDAGSIFAWQFFAHEDQEDGGLIGISAWHDDFVHELAPTNLVWCLDAGYAHRTAIDASYKANRRTKPKPEAFIDQLRRLPEFLTEAGIPWLRESGFESDDLLATLATRYSSDDCEVVVVSSDSDLSALVGDHCVRFDPRPNKEGKCEFYDTARVIERMGVPPHRVASYKALVGDPGDNITGVPGVGKVTALSAIQNTKSDTELFRRAAAGTLKDITPKMQAKIAAGKAEFEHAMRLVELRCDISVPDLEMFALNKAVAA